MEYEIKPGANLYGANLREADLYRANLEGAYLREADLSRANLREANLEGILYDDDTEYDEKGPLATYIINQNK